MGSPARYITENQTVASTSGVVGHVYTNTFYSKQILLLSNSIHMTSVVGNIPVHTRMQKQFHSALKQVFRTSRWQLTMSMKEETSEHIDQAFSSVNNCRKLLSSNYIGGYE